jgi:DNA-binding transcriptional ArsR family regulator
MEAERLSDATSVDLLARARIHAALGEPARLAIVDTLTVGDASPGEIAHILGIPTNLVAHHVKVLADASLVVRSRSEGDQRRTYLRLVPELSRRSPHRRCGPHRGWCSSAPTTRPVLSSPRPCGPGAAASPPPRPASTPPTESTLAP